MNISRRHFVFNLQESYILHLLHNNIPMNLIAAGYTERRGRGTATGMATSAWFSTPITSCATADASSRHKPSPHVGIPYDYR